VDIAWQNGILSSATIRSLNGGQAVLRYGQTVKNVEIKKGGTFEWAGK